MIVFHKVFEGGLSFGVEFVLLTASLKGSWNFVLFGASFVRIWTVLGWNRPFMSYGNI